METVNEKSLAEVLKDLSGFSQTFDKELREPLPTGIARLDRLKAVIVKLGDAKPVKQVHCPKDYLQEWKRFCQDHSTQLERRTIRYLCWEPQVATDPEFIACLTASEGELSARSLQGLVRCCHSLWSEFSAKSPAAAFVRRQVALYSGSNRLLRRWKESIDLILGPDAPREYGRDIAAAKRSIQSQAQFWGIDPGSRFVSAAVRECVQDWVASGPLDPALQRYLLKQILSWPGWMLQDFKAAVGATIIAYKRADRADSIGELRRFVLSDRRLLDPRLPRNAQNWLGVDEKAHAIFVQWLSREDIEFFFEHVLPRRDDPHGRKPFWLRYVGQLRRSRPLLALDDEVRLKATLSREKLVGNYGRMESWANTSAFLLDFGKVMVVEFSKVGNASFVYESGDIDSVVAEFWSEARFPVKTLKQQDLSQYRIVHRVGWQEGMRSILARYGVRP